MMIDKIEEIKQLAIDTTGELAEDEKNLLRIVRICDQILIDHQTNEALKRLENEQRLQP